MFRVILTAVFIFSPTQLIAQNIDDNFWVSVKPKTLGIDPSKIKSLNRIAFEDSSTQALIVVKNGKLIHEKYADGFDKTSPGTSWSVAKSFYAALVGISLEKGEIGSLDDPVSKYLPQFGDDRRSITLRNILNMRSGLEFPEDEHERMFLFQNQLKYALSVPSEKDPGSVWEYNNVNSMLLGEILKSATGKSASELLKNRILKPLGITNFTLWKDNSGNTMAYCCIDLNARDFTKFGMLFAGNGKWRDQQIVSKEFIDETFQTVSKFNSPRVGGYSMHWWVASNDEKNKIFYASGKYGQYIFVDRENDLVVTKITKYQPTGGSIQDFGDFQWLKEIDNFYILLTVSAFLESTGLMKFGEGYITTPITREAGQQTLFRKNFQSFVDILKELN